MADNYARMMDIINEVFDTRNDPEQLDVDEQAIERLHEIHPATLSERRDDDGPVAWVLVIPTTMAIAQQFTDGAISEGKLYKQTMPGMTYDAIYLCSATVLPEYRNKGMAKEMTLNAIHAIKEAHTIKALCVWPFSDEGAALAAKVAQIEGLSLLKRKP